MQLSVKLAEWLTLPHGATSCISKHMNPTRIAIAGLGAIGRAVARRLTDGLPGLSLACIATGNADKARTWLKEQKIDCPVVELEELPKYADLAVECAPASLIERI